MPGNRRAVGTQCFGNLNCVDKHEGPKLLGDTIHPPNCLERQCYHTLTCREKARF
jgi:hypothetical protein